VGRFARAYLAELGPGGRARLPILWVGTATVLSKAIGTLSASAVMIAVGREREVE
jgi:hypothetical protein